MACKHERAEFPKILIFNYHTNLWFLHSDSIPQGGYLESILKDDCFAKMRDIMSTLKLSGMI